jgi:hypothetical protein
MKSVLLTVWSRVRFLRTRYTKTIWATNDGRYAFPLSRTVGRLNADAEGYLSGTLYADIGAGSVPFELVSLDSFNETLKPITENDHTGSTS